VAVILPPQREIGDGSRLLQQGATRLDRCFQALLMFSTAALSWLLMLAVHESGHVLQGWLSGAKLDAVHLPLLDISQTDFAVNPHPLFVAWGGACWGSVLPLAVLIAARWFARKRGGATLCHCFAEAVPEEPAAPGTASAKQWHTSGCLSRLVRRADYLLAWFAGFCLIANGAYLLGGAILTGGADDGGVILRHGGARWQLVGFGVIAVAAGLYLWNGLGPHFGLGPSRGRVDRKAAVGVAITLLTVVCLESLLCNH
jgi:hypothetical protein